MVKFNVFPDGVTPLPSGFVYFNTAFAAANNGDILSLASGQTFTFNSPLIITKNIDFDNANPLDTKPIMLFTSAGGGIIIRADGVSIKGISIYGTSNVQRLIELTGTVVRINRCEIDTCDLYFTAQGIILNGLMNNTRNSGTININNNTFNRYSGSSLITCIVLTYFDSNVYIKNNTTYDNLANIRFVYLNSSGSATTSRKSGSINFLRNSFLNVSDDAFFYQDNFSSTGNKKLNVVFVDDPKGFNRCNAKYFIYLSNSGPSDMNIYNSMIIRNNYVTCNNAFVVITSPTDIVTNYRGVIQFTDDNQGIFSSLPNHWNVIGASNYLAYISNTGRIPNEINLRNLYKAVNRLTVRITTTELRSILAAVKSNDTVIIENNSITCGVANTIGSGNVITPPIAIASNVSATSTVSQTLTLENASTNTLYLLGMKEPDLVVSITTVLSKPVTSSFFIKAFDSSLNTAVGNLETTITLSNVIQKPFVNVFRLNEDTGSFIKQATAFRAPNKRTSYKVRFTNQSEYATVEEEETGALGDPYIKTLSGKVYKLPDKDAIYRLLQTDTLIINGQTRMLSQDEAMNTAQNAYQILKRGNYSITDPQQLIFENMCFFNRIYINNNGQECMIDMDKVELYNNGLEYILNEFTDDQQNILPLYNGIECNIKELVFQNEEIDWMAVRLHMYENMQIRNGVSLYLDKLCVPEYACGILNDIDRPVSMYEISNLNSTEQLSTNYSGHVPQEIKKEVFYRNDGKIFELNLIQV